MSTDVWEELYNEKYKRKYYKNKTTGEKLWTKPSYRGAIVATSTPVEVSSPSSSWDWKELYSDKHQRKYWKNTKTGETTWKEPPKPAATDATSDLTNVVAAASSWDWKELYSEKHQRKYWKNTKTGETTWKEPSREAVATTSANGTSVAAATTTTAASWDWKELYSDKHQRKYWKNTKTGETTWKEPPKPAATDATSDLTNVVAASSSWDWKELYSEKHKRKYWKNTKTGETTWKEPPKPAAADAATNLTTSTSSWDWKELYSEKHKRKYWKNTKTGETTWKEPPKPATTDMATDTSQWIEYYSDEYQRKYWVHKVTNESTWDNPVSAVTSISSNSQYRTIKFFAWIKVENNWVRFFGVLSGGDTLPVILNIFNCVTFNEDNTNEPSFTVELSQVKSIVCNAHYGGIDLDRKAAPSAESSSTKVERRGSLNANSLKKSLSYALKFTSNEESQWIFNSMILRVANPRVVPLNEIKYASAADNEILVCDGTSNFIVLPPEVVDNRTVHLLSSIPHSELVKEIRWITSQVNELQAAAQSNSQIKAQIDVQHERLEKLLAHTYKMTQSYNESYKYSLQLDTILPFSGIVIAEICKKNVAYLSNAASIWVKIDVSNKAIYFHDRGPNSIPVFVADVSLSNLTIPKLVDREELSVEVVDCKKKNLGSVSDANKDDTQYNILFKFYTIMDFWRWSVAIGSACGNGCALLPAEIVPTSPSKNGAKVPIGMQKLLENSSPAKQNQQLNVSNMWNNNLLSIAMTAINSLAERHLPKQTIRTAKLPGAVFKTCSFELLNKRLVLKHKGSSSLVEGSVLISVNGLSAVTMSGPLIMKFIDELPRQEEVEVVLWKFPRADFKVNVLAISAPLRKADASDNKLATTWKQTSIILSDGTVNCVIGYDDNNDNDVLFHLKLSACQWRWVHNKDGMGALDLALELKDSATHILISHSHLKQFLTISEKIIMSMKLLGSLQADLSILYDFSSQSQVDGAAYRGLVDGNDEGNMLQTHARNPSTTAASSMGGHADAIGSISKGLFANNTSPRNGATPISTGAMSEMNSSFQASNSIENMQEERMYIGKDAPTTPGNADYYSYNNSNTRDNMNMKGLKPSAEKVQTFNALHSSFNNGNMASPEMLQAFNTLQSASTGGMSSANKFGGIIASPSIGATHIDRVYTDSSTKQGVSVGGSSVNKSLGGIMASPSVSANNADKMYTGSSQKQQFLSPVQTNADDHDDTHFLSVRPMRYEAGTALERFKNSVEKRGGATSPDTSAISMSFNDNNQDLVSAANEVSKLLASMNIPPVFPSPKFILEIANKLASDNQYNHNLIAELLKLDSISTDYRDNIKVNEGTLQQSWSPNFASPVTPKTKSKIMTFPDVPEDSDAIDAMQSQSIGRRSSTRGSISLDITPKVPLFVQQLSSFSPSTIENTMFAAPVSVPVHPLEISESDLAHCSEVVFYFREDPAFLLAALKNMNKLQALGFVRIMVDRIFSPWSCDDDYFGAIIEQLAIHDTISFKNKATNNTGFSLVKILMSCIWSRYDVSEYLKYLCNAVELNSVISTLTLENIAENIVEPVCKRFEASMSTHVLPNVLLQMLGAVSKIGDNTSLANILSEELVPLFAKWLSTKIISMTNKALDAKQRGFINKLGDLFTMSFGKLLTKPLKLSISETSCITRCKWLLDKIYDHIRSNSTVASKLNKSLQDSANLSPIACLAKIQSCHSKPDSLIDTICMKPSELAAVLVACVAIDSSSNIPRNVSSSLDYLTTSSVYNSLASENAAQYDHNSSVILKKATKKSSNNDYADIFTNRMGSDEEIPGYSELLGMQWLVNVARTTLNKVYNLDSSNAGVASGHSQERASLRELISLKDKLSQKKDAIVKCLADGVKLQNAGKLLECYRDHIDILLSKHTGSSSGNSTKQDADINNSRSEKLSTILDEQRSIEGNSIMLHKGTPAKNGLRAAIDENSFDGNSLAIEEKFSESTNGSYGYKDHVGRLKHSGAGDNPLWTVVRDVYPLSYTDVSSHHDKIPL